MDVSQDFTDSPRTFLFPEFIFDTSSSIISIYPKILNNYIFLNIIYFKLQM